MDWSAFRNQFPAVKERTYLNTAGGGAMSVQAARAGKAYYDESEMYADVHWDEWLDRSNQVRIDVARLIAGSPDHVSFLQNTSLGFNIVARMFDMPIEILAIDKEFPSCTIPWLRAGHSVRFMETELNGAVTADDVEMAIREETRVFVLSSVQFATGYRADLGAIGAVCHRHGVHFVVDATQSICAYEIDVESAHIGALLFSGYKWATAGYGITVMHLNSALAEIDPPLVGWRSASEPYLLENNRLDLAHSGIGHEMGHPTFPGIFALGAALSVFNQAGMSHVSARIDSLVGTLRNRLEDSGYNVLSSSNKETSSGILKVGIDQPEVVSTELRKRDVWTTARDGGLRISVHAYNDESDIERLIDALSEIRRQDH